MINQPPFEIGQRVFVATASPYHQVEVPCPICFGKRIVKLELGNGEIQPVECDYCGKGFGGPRGVVKEYTVSSAVIEGEVTGVTNRYGEWKIDCNHCSYDLNTIFTSREDAEAQRVLLHAKAEELVKKNYETQFKTNAKQSTWTIGYHKNCIKSLEKQMAWHRQKLGDAAERRREG